MWFEYHRRTKSEFISCLVSCDILLNNWSVWEAGPSLPLSCLFLSLQGRVVAFNWKRHPALCQAKLSHTFLSFTLTASLLFPQPSLWRHIECFMRGERKGHFADDQTLLCICWCLRCVFVMTSLRCMFFFWWPAFAVTKAASCHHAVLESDV